MGRKEWKVEETKNNLDPTSLNWNPVRKLMLVLVAFVLNGMDVLQKLELLIVELSNTRGLALGEPEGGFRGS